jgi:hypothetical protein
MFFLSEKELVWIEEEEEENKMTDDVFKNISKTKYPSMNCIFETN